MHKPREKFHFNPPIRNIGDWMSRLTDSEEYNSIFNITEEIFKIELYKFRDEKAGGVSYEKVRDEVEGDLDIFDITATDIQDDMIGPIIIENYREQLTRRMKDERYLRILSISINSVFQDFESFLKTEIYLVEDNIKLVLDEYNSSFITYEITPSIYTFKVISKALFNNLQPEYELYNNSIDIEYDDVTMKTKLVVRPGTIAIRFDEKSFFSTVLGFTSGWDYEHYNEYTSQRILDLGSTNKIHLKCYVIDGSVVNGLRQPIFYSFVLDKLPGYKILSEPETIHYKKINKSVLNTITFYLEDDNNE